ncbi:hypothetical protein Tco_0127945 [Tanacetum coccineum]
MTPIAAINTTSSPSPPSCLFISDPSHHRHHRYCHHVAVTAAVPPPPPLDFLLQHQDWYHSTFVYRANLLGKSVSLGVDISNWEMFDDAWGLESKEVSPLGEELSLFDRPNKVERGRILEA